MTIEDPPWKKKSECLRYVCFGFGLEVCCPGPRALFCSVVLFVAIALWGALSLDVRCQSDVLKLCID